MKAAELRSKTPDQLKEELNSLRKEQFNFRFQRTTGQLENTSRVRAVRRDIARIKTLLAAQKKPAAAAKVKKAAAPKKAAAKKAKGE